MKLTVADGLLLWLALQLPLGILVGHRLRRNQPPAPDATTPEEGNR